jgi:hypothetical protein
MEDKDTALAFWGSTIEGIDEGEGWIRMRTPDRSGNRLFLPESVRGNRVLVLQEKSEKKGGLFNLMHKTGTPPSDVQPPQKNKTSFFSFGGSKSVKHPRESGSPRSPLNPAATSPRSPASPPATEASANRLTATFGLGEEEAETPNSFAAAYADQVSWTTGHRYVGAQFFLPADTGPHLHSVTAYRSGIPPRFRILREGGTSADATEVKQSELEELLQAAKVLIWKPEREDQGNGWKPTGHTYIGRRIMRVFQGKDICGTIVGFNEASDFGADDGPDFRVLHDDEDEEDLTQAEVEIGFALHRGGVAKIQRRAPETRGTKLLVTFVKTKNFESIPHIRHDAGFWCLCMVENAFDASEQPKNSCKCNVQEMRSSPPQTVIDPEWNEQHMIDHWRPGQALFFAIFMKGAGASKIVGITRLDDAHTLSTGLFSGFDGDLPIRAAAGHPMAGEAMLHVRVEVLEPGHS